MVRRAENVRIYHKPGMFTGKGLVTVSVGRSTYTTVKLHKTVFAQQLGSQREYPLCVLRTAERQYWMFQDKFYWVNDDLDAGQVYALIVTKQQRESQRINRAQAMVAIGEQPRQAKRGVIPDDVKQYVWMRDGGQCCHCGSGVELQYDHVIPVALGGADDAQNLQILCGPCNRRKGASLTVDGAKASARSVGGVDTATAVQTAPAGWYPDASGGRRWWDGNRWTDHVS